MQIKPKKSLGQNFLIDKNIENKIVAAPGFSKEDIILEIGSGKGDISVKLSGLVKNVYALEIDERLYPELEQKLNSVSNCRLVKGDILKLDLDQFCAKNCITQKIKVIGNIPYYISSPIIEQLIKFRARISEAYLTVQKEFGQRLAAGPGSKEYGSFSCFVQYYAKIKILFIIKNSCFRPIPKVDSSFLSLKFRDPEVEVGEEEGFFKFIRSAFSQRRKTLRNTLNDLIDSDLLEEGLKSLGIDRNTRPEQLNLEQFASLFKKSRKKT